MVSSGIGIGCLYSRSSSSSILSGSSRKKVASSYSACSKLFIVINLSAFCRGRILDHPKLSLGLR